MHRTESIGGPFATNQTCMGRNSRSSEERSQQMMTMIIPYHYLNETFSKNQTLIKHILEKC